MTTITFLNGEILTPADDYELTEDEKLQVFKAEINEEKVLSNRYWGCIHLKTLILSESVKVIGSGAFMGCVELEGHLNLPSTLTKIGDFAFHKCSSLIGNLIIPDTCIHIGTSAFNGCSGFNGFLYYPTGCLAYNQWDKNHTAGNHFLGVDNVVGLRLEDIVTLDEKIGCLIRQLVISEIE